MLAEIEALFTQEVAAEAARRYGVSLENLKPIGGFESYVYEYVRDGVPYILKITNEIRRSVDEILGEVEWIRHLANHGVPVCDGAPSQDGLYVEVIPAGSDGGEALRSCNFLAISYRKARGHEPGAEDWTEALFERFGQVMGHMHHATKEYRVSQANYRRQEWYEEEQLQARKYVLSDPVFVHFVEQKLETLRDAFDGTDEYGLVHSDLSPRNYFVTENGTLDIFDFDDTGYHPFVNDIAIAWYYALSYPPKEPDDLKAYVTRFIHCFLQGYRQARAFDWASLKLIPEFMNVRHALNYILFHQTNRFEDLNETGRAMLLQHRNEVMNGMELAHMVKDVLAQIQDVQGCV